MNLPQDKEAFMRQTDWRLVKEMKREFFGRLHANHEVRRLIDTVKGLAVLTELIQLRISFEKVSRFN